MELIVLKIMVFFMVMAVLDILRELFNIIKCFNTLKEYEINKWRTLTLWCSISYIITMLITGF